MGKKITIDALPGEIAKILSDYGDEVTDHVNDAAEKVGKVGTRALNASSGAAFGGKKYRRSWTSETVKHGSLGSTVVLYSRKPGLPHLLEYGHAKRGGGRVAGRAHIAPVEQILMDTFETKVRAMI